MLWANLFFWASATPAAYTWEFNFRRFQKLSFQLIILIRIIHNTIITSISSKLFTAFSTTSNRKWIPVSLWPVPVVSASAAKRLQRIVLFCWMSHQLKDHKLTKRSCFTLPLQQTKMLLPYDVKRLFAGFRCFWITGSNSIYSTNWEETNTKWLGRPSHLALVINTACSLVDRKREVTTHSCPAISRISDEMVNPFPLRFKISYARPWISDNFADTGGKNNQAR